MTFLFPARVADELYSMTQLKKVALPLTKEIYLNCFIFSICYHLLIKLSYDIDVDNKMVCLDNVIIANWTLLWGIFWNDHCSIEKLYAKGCIVKGFKFFLKINTIIIVIKTILLETTMRVFFFFLLCNHLFAYKTSEKVKTCIIFIFYLVAYKSAI